MERRKWPDCPYKSDTKEYRNWVRMQKRREKGILPPVRLTDEERKGKQAARSRKKYLEKRDFYIQQRHEQAKREAQDRVLARAGDVEAKQRVEKMNKYARERNWKVSKCIPRQEYHAIQTAVSFVLAPLRKQTELEAKKERRAAKRQEILLGVANGDPEALERIAKEKYMVIQRQKRWRERTQAKADAGDEEAKHSLWKLTPDGKVWRENQIANGLGTKLSDK